MDCFINVMPGKYLLMVLLWLASNLDQVLTGASFMESSMIYLTSSCISAGKTIVFTCLSTFDWRGIIFYCDNMSVCVSIIKESIYVYQIHVTNT